jgi:uroporphyrinogen-III decarboxylase
MTLGTSARFYLSNPQLNTRGITYEEFHTDADIMMEVQLEHQYFRRHHIFADHEMGLPDEWGVMVAGGNFSHSAWYGAKVHYSNYDSPDTVKMLTDDNKHTLFDRGLPDPFGGIFAHWRRVYERLKKKASDTTFKGRPISPHIGSPPASTMGNGIPFTTACKLRGTPEMCMDMAADPEYAKQLLAYITESAIRAIKAWREYLGTPVVTDYVFLGDDSIVLLSPEMYRDFVLPYHRRIYEEFGTSDAKRGIHLCGAAQKHLPILAKELNVREFDTGYPIDLKALYEEVGPEVRIQGGVTVELLRSGSATAIREESRRILQSVKPYKKFVFRDANLLAPRTPLGNLQAMYDACKEYGRYR